MARTSRSRKIKAPPATVWEVVADPHHLPRWWPGVARVEDVGGGRFTEVIPTRRGRPVRLDFVVLESQPMRRRSWTQELAGTPFERLLKAWTTTITLQDAGDGACLVTLEEHQQLRGSFRAGLLLQRRPASRRVESALNALAALF
ncbi:MAG: SRPBCC family protein [Acidobacteriota bacterium]|nr:SRPBCC family protein [Acidobacteriota bacterium]